jgi:hypothetical protein
LSEFIGKYKNLPYYKKRDSDSEGVRIHVSYIDDPNLLESSLTFRYEIADGNYRNVINDGTQETKKESTISNDTAWLLGSNGHDTVVELSNETEKYLDIMVTLLKKGYETYITSRVYADKYWKMLEDAATEGSTRVIYCDDVYCLLGKLDQRYQQKLDQQRKNLLEDSYTATPCFK